MSICMVDIAICIPTFKRPEMLSKTISSILDNDITGLGLRCIHIVVVDNDSDQSARETVDSWSRKTQEPYQIKYRGYPKKGLSNVRNELLHQALLLDPMYIIFIDDDEYASERWLANLIACIKNNQADMVLGSVSSVFEYEVPDAIAYWFDKGVHPDSSPIQHLASNNLIIKTDFIKESGLRFDLRFNTTGAEDTFFGIQAIRKGAKIFWSQKAGVYETVPKQRATLNWILKRRYRGGMTYTYIIIQERQYLQLVKKIIVSGIYLLVGTVASPAVVLPVKWRYWGLVKISEAWGAMAGILNIKYHEYK